MVGRLEYVLERSNIPRTVFPKAATMRQCVAGSRKCNYRKITYRVSFGPNRTAPTLRLLTLRIFNKRRVRHRENSLSPAHRPTHHCGTGAGAGAAIDPDISGCDFSTHVDAGERNSEVSSRFPLLAAIPETMRELSAKKEFRYKPATGVYRESITISRDRYKPLIDEATLNGVRSQRE